MDDSENIDAAHVQQMVNFLKAWSHGVNAFAFVVNGQTAGFDQGTQKLVQFLICSSMIHCSGITFASYSRNGSRNAVRQDKNIAHKIWTGIAATCSSTDLQ
jgi:hypothetical protein